MKLTTSELRLLIEAIECWLSENNSNSDTHTLEMLKNKFQRYLGLRLKSEARKVKA